jgi:hypothetical protein
MEVSFLIRFDQKRWDKSKKKGVVVKCYYGEVTASRAYTELIDNVPEWVTTAHGRFGGTVVSRTVKMK